MIKVTGMGRAREPIPLPVGIDFWVRYFIRTYLLGLIICQHFYFLADLFGDLPGSRLVQILFVALFFPAAFTATCLAVRILGLRRGTYTPEYAEHEPGTGFRAVLSQMRWLAAALGLFAVWSCGYLIVAELAGWRTATTFNFEMDARIPLRTEFTFIYLSVYWFFLMPMLYGSKKEHFWPLVKSYLTVVAVAYTTFLLFPVEFPREPFVGNSVGDYALRIVRASDPPNNCFPSTHCAMAALAALSLLHMDLKKGILAAYLALAIGVSTLFTKQHYVVDVLASYVLAGAVYTYHFRLRWWSRHRAVA